MSRDALDETPMFNPRQSYQRGRHDIPPEERARDVGLDWLFGYSLKNRVTRRQLAERGVAASTGR